METKEILDIKDLKNIKNFNLKTILSIITLIAGIIFYILWGVTYGVWADIGIYSITIVLVLGGIFGIMLSILESKDKD